MLALAAATPLGAQQARPDSAAFVTRLGNDTLVVERFVRTDGRMEAEVVLRAPRTSRTRYVLELTPSGGIQRLTTESVTPGQPNLARREVMERVGDSLRITAGGPQGERTRMVPAPAATLPFIDMVHWPFELALLRARAAGTDSVMQPLLSGQRPQDFVIARVGADSMTITHPFRGTMRVHVDERGRLMTLDASATTRKLLVERKPWSQPLDELAQRWAALDAQGRGIGDLSGRGAGEATVHGAEITLDYGTPMKRGREIWGALVPYGVVWRTGANRATHITTSRDLVFGTGADTLRVPAGEYTLFSIPEADGGLLIVNKQTGQNGNSYDASHDLGRVRMQARPLPEMVEVFTIRAEEEGDRGVLRLQWDRMELVAPFRVVR